MLAAVQLHAKGFKLLSRSLQSAALFKQSRKRAAAQSQGHQPATNPKRE